MKYNVKERHPLVATIVFTSVLALSACSDSSPTTPIQPGESSDVTRLATANESESVRTSIDTDILDSYADPGYTWVECNPERGLPAVELGKYNVNLNFVVLNDECNQLESSFDIELHGLDIFAEEESSTEINKWLDVSLDSDNMVQLQFTSADLERTAQQSGAENALGYFFKVSVNENKDDQTLCFVGYNSVFSEADTAIEYTIITSKTTEDACPTNEIPDDVDDMDPDGGSHTVECEETTETNCSAVTQDNETQDNEVQDNETQATENGQQLEICVLDTMQEIRCEVIDNLPTNPSTDVLPSCFAPGYIEALEAGEDVTPFILGAEACE